MDLLGAKSYCAGEEGNRSSCWALADGAGPFLPDVNFLWIKPEGSFEGKGKGVNKSFLASGMHVV